jgi:hypothetical protein
MQLVVESSTPGTRAFAFGQLDLFEDLPLVFVAGVGRLEGHRGGPGRQHQVGRAVAQRRLSRAPDGTQLSGMIIISKLLQAT